MEKLTKRESQVLTELLKNAKTTDQEIARRIGISRPGIAKIRERLETRGIIKGYRALPDYEKLGLKIHVILLYRWKDYSKKQELENVTEYIKKLPQVLLFVKGEGMGSKTNAIISLHEQLEDYEKFIRDLKNIWKDNVEDVEVFLSSVSGISKEYYLNSPALEKLKNTQKNH